MKKTTISIIAALAAVLILPFTAFALNGPATPAINTPAQWIPNTASSTITPNPNTLQVPCANIVGGCSSGSSSTPGGAKNSIQFNASGTLGGASGFSYSSTTGQITVSSTVSDSFSGSQSTGGKLNLNGTNATTSVFVVYDNQANEVSGTMVQMTCDVKFNTFDCVVIRGMATGTTSFDVQGSQVGKGTIKIEHNQPTDGESDANASALSIALNGTSTAAQGIFMDSASGTTGSDLQIRDKGVTLFSFTPEGNGLVVVTPATFNGITNNGNVTSTSFTATSSAIASYIANFDTIQYMPTNFATAGCAGSSTATGILSCAQAIYDASASSVLIMAPVGNYTDNFNLAFTTNGKYGQLQCVPGGGTVINYTGSGSPVTIGDTGGTRRAALGMVGCTLLGPSATGTTVGVTLGGTLGAPWVVLAYNDIEGFGTCLSVGNQTYTFTSDTNVYRNCGSAWLFNGTVNTGESLQSTHDRFLEAPTSTVSTCVNFSTGGFTDAHFDTPDFDNCGVSNSNTSTQFNILTINHAHFENANKNIAYPFITNATSTSNIVSVSDSLVMNDGTSTAATPTSSFKNSGIMTLSNVFFSKTSGATAMANGVDNGTAGVLSAKNAYTVDGALTSFADNSAATSYSSYDSVNGGNPTALTDTFLSIGSSSCAGMTSNYLCITGAASVTSTPTLSIGAGGGLASTSFAEFNGRAGIGYNGASQSLDAVVSGGKPFQVFTNAGSVGVGVGTLGLYQSGAAGATLGHVAVGTTSAPATLTLVDITNNSSSLRIGAVSKNSCLEMSDASNTANLYYVFISSGVVTSTATKPAFCQ